MRVLDATGQELREGDEVERCFETYSGAQVHRTVERRGGGGLRGRVLHVAYDGAVTVAFGVHNPTFFESERLFRLRRTYRCNDLIRTDERRG